MPFAVGLGCEGKVARETAEGPLAVMCAQVSDQGRLVGARVGTQVTLVSGEA